MERIIAEKINILIKKENWIEELLEELQKYYDVIIFGGAIRDILYGCSLYIRDLDIVLVSKCADRRNEKVLCDIVNKYTTGVAVRQNQFGGYKLCGRTIEVDMWLLEDTWAFRTGLLTTSEENLLKSVYLNIDAYAWKLSTHSFIQNCDEMIYSQIDIVLEESKCELLNLIRAVHLGKKYKLASSLRIRDKLTNVVDRWEEMEKLVYSTQNEHFGKVFIRYEDIVGYSLEGKL